MTDALAQAVTSLESNLPAKTVSSVQELGSTVAADAVDPRHRVAVLLLKTRSVPKDGYQTLFARSTSLHTASSLLPLQYEPVFVPVLTNAPLPSALDRLEGLLRAPHTLTDQYGGLIFTSQRAVEAFARVLERVVGVSEQSVNVESRHKDSRPEASNEDTARVLASISLPLYTVGPATGAALKTLCDAWLPCCRVEGGAAAGSGEALARYILAHHGRSAATTTRTATVDIVAKRSLLFLVGEVRRDIIRTTLMSTELAEPERIHVDEVEVYATAERTDFESELVDALQETAQRTIYRWLVVFSPTGCAAMLRALAWLNTDGQVTKQQHDVEDKSRKIFVASIGPTTRDYLAGNFSLEVDVCAHMPSPEGLSAGIEAFMLERGLLQRLS